MQINRRQSLIWMGAATASLIVPTSTYAGERIEIIIPQQAGGAGDVAVRRLTQALAGIVDDTFIVVNRPGGAQLTGSGVAARAAPDGKTILLGGSAALTIQPQLRDDMTFQPEDLTPVGMFFDGPLAIAVNSDFGVTDLAGFVEKARGLGRPVRCASTGPGSVTHLFGIMFGEAMGLNLTPIAYDGNAPSTTALLAGEIDVNFETPAATLPHVETGRLQHLAVSQDERLRLVPNVPTLAELGYPELTAGFWVGFMVPTGTPREKINELNRVINQVIEAPEWAEWMDQLGQRIVPGTPEDFAARIEGDVALWGAIIRAHDIRLD